MNSVAQNQQVQEGLLSHIKNRISIRNMYQDRGIIALDKPQNITLDEEKSKNINDLQIQIKQLNKTILILKKQKSDLEANQNQPELSKSNQKSYQDFQNYGQQNNQVQANQNAQHMVQQNPNVQNTFYILTDDFQFSNQSSNNNVYALDNQQNSNNQVQGSIQQQMNLFQQPNQCQYEQHRLKLKGIGRNTCPYQQQDFNQKHVLGQKYYHTQQTIEY
ncbi:hypothetical protein ABPG74_002608, partial [Tetrahymena malaccensis]